MKPFVNSCMSLKAIDVTREMKIDVKTVTVILFLLI